MAEISFSLVDLFRQMGVHSSAFTPDFTSVSGDNKLHRGVTGNFGSPYYANDALGREYFLPVTVIYPDSSGNLVTYELPYPVISIRGNKHVVETPLTERRGTVSELISTESYKISIKGFVINTVGNEMPEDELVDFRNFFECDMPFSIKCPLTDVFLLRPDRKGSDQVTIRSFELPYSIGVKNVKTYSIELVSEEPFNLIEIA